MVRKNVVVCLTAFLQRPLVNLPLWNPSREMVRRPVANSLRPPRKAVSGWPALGGGVCERVCMCVWDGLLLPACLLITPAHPLPMGECHCLPKSRWPESCAPGMIHHATHSNPTMPCSPPKAYRCQKHSPTDPTTQPYS